MSAPDRPMALPSHLPDAEWRRKPGLSLLAEALGAAAGEARFVGGAVRDALLGIAAKDVDIATIHSPREVIERVTRAGFKPVPTGIDHGTITAVLHGWPVEVTTLRRDVSTDGRRATVAFGTDWREDAARRDFTMNALYADPTSGAITDWFGGLEDLAAGRVRFIGDPAQRIAEDHLRILRYFRFVARFGALDPASADHAACVAHAPSLMALSRERIADEMLRLLALPDPVPVLRAMVEDEVLAAVLPEINATGADALASLVTREKAAGIPPDALRRLAALLPDDAPVARQVAARLRLSNKARRRLTVATTGPADEEKGGPVALAYRIGTEGARDRILLGRALTMDALTDLPVEGALPVLPLSGGDLIAMGLPAGPVVARTLQRLEREWTEAGFPPPDQTRSLALRLVEESLREAQKS
ncbi:CCA tRNA nucleotidyltransferase [Sphingobium sp. CR28]|uniref:CCA tRNA nucleotidyltransferase n=1 Tax=Sphingobium sp. CR28 TaxID=3400272 RepID=UPI003FEEA36C